MNQLKQLDIPIAKELAEHTNYLDNDFFILDNLSALHIPQEQPFRLGALAIALCLHGEMSLTVNMKEQHIQAGNMLITLPQDIIEHQYVSADIKGIFFVASQHFIEEAFPKIDEILPVFLHIQRHPKIELPAEQVSIIQQFYKFFKQRLKDNSYYKNKLISSILKAFIYHIASLLATSATDSKKERKEELLSNFIQLIIRYYKENRTLAFYADKLCISSKYLSYIVKEASGRTAHEWIDQYTILEAKILLRSTDKTIQQISDELNFPNNSFFSKYFKKHVGMTPKEYKRS